MTVGEGLESRVAGVCLVSRAVDLFLYGSCRRLSGHVSVRTVCPVRRGVAMHTQNALAGQLQSFEIYYLLPQRESCIQT